MPNRHLIIDSLLFTVDGIGELNLLFEVLVTNLSKIEQLEV